MTQEARERSRIVGIAAVGAAAVVAIVVTLGIFFPALGSLAAGGVRSVDAASLPASIRVCDRDYVRSGTTLDTLAGARSRVGAEPVIVGTNGGCVDGVCVRNNACLEIVFVATSDGRYAAYEAADAST